MLPALHVGLGPSVPVGGIEFLSGRDDGARWLYAPGDMLIAKVIDRPVTVFLTSVRAAGAQALAVEVDRLDPRSEPAADGAGARNEPPRSSEEPLRVQLTAHISNRGDVVFIDTDWAGRLGRGLSIEAFSVVPLERLGAGISSTRGSPALVSRAPGSVTARRAAPAAWGSRSSASPCGSSRTWRPGAIAASTGARFAPVRSARSRVTVSCAGQRRRATRSKGSSCG